MKQKPSRSIKVTVQTAAFGHHDDHGVNKSRVLAKTAEFLRAAGAADQAAMALRAAREAVTAAAEVGEDLTAIARRAEDAQLKLQNASVMKGGELIWNLPEVERAEVARAYGEKCRRKLATTAEVVRTKKNLKPTAVADKEWAKNAGKWVDENSKNGEAVCVKNVAEGIGASVPVLRKAMPAIKKMGYKTKRGCAGGILPKRQPTK